MDAGYFSAYYWLLIPEAIVYLCVFLSPLAYLYMLYKSSSIVRASRGPKWLLVCRVVVYLGISIIGLVSFINMMGMILYSQRWSLTYQFLVQLGISTCLLAICFISIASLMHDKALDYMYASRYNVNEKVLNDFVETVNGLKQTCDELCDDEGIYTHD